MGNLKSIISRSIIEAKDTYVNVFGHFKYLLFMSLPAIFFMLIMEPLVVTFLGFSINDKNVELMKANAGQLTLIMAPLVILQLAYGAKAARAWHILWLKGAPELMNYKLLSWTKSELQFFKTTLFYLLVLMLVTVLLMVLFLIVMVVTTSVIAIFAASMSKAFIMPLILFFTSATMMAITIFIMLFGLKRVFILPARALDNPIKMKMSKELSKGHIKHIVVTMLFTAGPIMLLSTGLQTLSENMGSDVVSTLLNAVSYILGFVVSMLTVYVVCRYYEIITR